MTQYNQMISGKMGRLLLVILSILMISLLVLPGLSNRPALAVEPGDCTCNSGSSLMKCWVYVTGQPNASCECKAGDLGCCTCP
jgi:hypothetical protein